MTVQVPRRGTRGMPFPRLPSWLAGLFSRRQLRGFRARGGGRTPGGVPTIMLHTTGAKSGEPRTAMLGYVEEAGGAWLVTSSLAGAARNPAWIYNLGRRPEAEIEFGDGRRIQVRAATLEGDELEAAWRLIAARAPEYVKYQSKTDRTIAVVRLLEIGGEPDRPGSTESTRPED